MTKLNDYFRLGVVDPLGYFPNSSSTKPVHIANGLCRAALGGYSDPRLLNHAVNRWVKREERHSTEDLVDEAEGRLGDLGLAAHRPQLNQLRELLRAVLNADGAVYDRNEYCSYTLTHKSHVTRDNNDRGTGEFLYHLLAVDLGQGPSPALALLRDLLDDASDEICILSLPLVSDEGPTSVSVDEQEPPEALRTKPSPDGRDKTFRSPIVRELRQAFDTLAGNERVSGSKLHSLRHVVAFSAFALFLHVINRSLDYEDGRTFKVRRPPLLLDFLQRGWSPVGLASHATYNLASKSVERMVSHGVRVALAQEHGDRWTTRQVETFIEGIELKGSPKVQERKRKHFLEVFRSYSGASGVGDAFALAVVDALLDEMSGTPIDFARALGVRGGLLAPRGQRAVRKRYAPSPDLLEVLLAASMESGEDLDLETLADRWWERYGILTGARPADARELARWSILDATKEDLAENAEALRTTLIDIGHARAYADGVTIIRLATGTAAG